MKKSLDLNQILTRLQVIIAAGTILAAAAGFLFQQAQWGILIGMLILLAGLLVIHLLKVERTIPMSERTEQVFWFEHRQRATAGILLSGLLLAVNLVQFFPPTSQYVQSVFWNAAPAGTRFVEQFQFDIYHFFGDDSPQGTGSGYVQVSNVYQGNRSALKYRFDYSLPKPNANSYAGFGINFLSPVDVSKYRYIAFMMKPVGSQARIRVSLKDAAKNDNAVLLGDGKYASGDQGQEILIPLSEFPGIVTSMVKEIVFSVDGTIAKGNGSVTIEKIRFIR